MLIQSAVDSILESAIDHYLKFSLFCNATRKLNAAVDPVNHMVYAMDTGAGKMVGLKYDSSKIFHIPLDVIKIELILMTTGRGSSTGGSESDTIVPWISDNDGQE